MKVAILLITILFSGLISTSADESKDEVLNVRHLAPTGTIFKEAPYENMWYYRTEILNKTKQPLRIVWFESYLKYNGHWYGANVLGKTLRSKEFSSWYTEGLLKMALSILVKKLYAMSIGMVIKIRNSYPQSGHLLR